MLQVILNIRRWLVFVVLSVFVMAQQSSAVEDAPLWNIAIQPAKGAFLVAEPVLLRVTISNNAATPVTVYTKLQNGVGATYEISRDNVAFTRIHPGFYRDPAGSTQLLAPGDIFVHDEVLLLNWRNTEPLFQIGTNYVRVNCYGKLSQSAQIVVTGPSNQDDEAASKIMTRPEIMKAVALRNLDNVRASFEVIAMGKSAYSPYAAFFLALVETNKLNAIVLLDKADVTGFPLQSRAVLEKGRINLALGNKQKAHEQFERVVNEFPNSAAFFEVKQRKLLKSSQP